MLRLFDMVGCLASAVDLVSPEVAGHHRRVGILAQALGEEAGLDSADQADLALAGMLHDVGAFSLKDRLSALAFESTDQTHPEIGARLLEGFPGMARAAGLVRAHHTPWKRWVQRPASAARRAGQPALPGGPPGHAVAPRPGRPWTVPGSCA